MSHADIASGGATMWPNSGFLGPLPPVSAEPLNRGWGPLPPPEKVPRTANFDMDRALLPFKSQIALSLLSFEAVIVVWDTAFRQQACPIERAPITFVPVE
jgi:hypothetical protein